MRRLLWVIAAVACCWGASQAAADKKKVRPPLVGEEGRRKLQKQTHCQFGNQSYELEERWRPDLGPPFGMLFCMRCECVPVQRKRRIVSRVKCKNIKNDCPKPTCDNPVLLPQRCCKTCPGEDYADLEEDIAARKLDSEDEEKVLKEFSVLLTGKILVPPVKAAGAARGYLTYTKRDLHYTIHYKGIPRPLALRFTSEEGNILEEHEIPAAPHHSQVNKVCGVWRRVPKVYRRLLLKEKLMFTVVTIGHPDGIVGGRIMKHTSINTESYGSLLLPDSKSTGDVLGTGGMASIFPVSDGIHVSLGFNGIFTSKDARDVPLVVSLAYEDSDRTMNPLTEVSITLSKAHPDYNVATVKLDLDPELQDRLSSGKLELKISSMDGQRHQSGRIIPKVTCNVFEAVITASEVVDVSKDPVTGFIILDISPDGFINYKLHISDPNIESVTIQLETNVETLQGSGMRILQTKTQNLTETWGNGSFARRSSQEVEMMLTDDLSVSVYAEERPMTTSSSILYREDVSPSGRTRSTRSEKNRIELQGHVRQRLYTDALLNEAPILLSGGNSTAGGVAWLTVDKDCILHYQVYVTGLDPRERHLLELLQIRPNKQYDHPLQRVLKRFEGDQVEDIAEDLDGRSLAYLQAGYTFLVVTSKLSAKAKAVQLRAPISEVSAPPNCMPRYDVPSMQRSGTGNVYHDGYNDVYGPGAVNKCFYEDNTYEDGAHWKAEHEECSMCSCQRGRVNCERSVCPEPVCDNPISIPGECCPFCPGNSTSSDGRDPHRAPQRLCYFDQGDKKYHVAGSRWHPYIPPFGFSRCSLCTCESKTLTVKCERITCPPLACSEKDAYREHENACCKKCPNSISVKTSVIIPPSAGHLGDQGGEKTIAKEILAAGGCKFRGQVYPNGDEWHPTIEPYGIERCIKCHCKDGRAKCRRKKCPKESCPIKIQSDDGCCEKCLESANSSESSRSTEGKGKKRRKERERRHRKARQPKDKQQ